MKRRTIRNSMAKRMKCGVTVMTMMAVLVMGTFYTAPQAAEAKLVVGIYGDVDANRVVNAQDALMILQHAVGEIKLTSDQRTAADMNGDFIINATDALEVLKIAAGMK